MALHASLLLACLLFAGLLFESAAGAETIYKYRRADGQMTYSNRLIPGEELIETFEYKFAPPAAPDRKAPKAAAAADERIKVHLSALDKAWSEVQAATRALAAAEARQAAGDDPRPGEAGALAGPPPAALPSTEAGGPQASAAPAAGGPAPAAPAAVGGPMGTQRGGRRNAEYFERTAALDAAVIKARARLDAALKAYNQLR
jgi:hypothetical protein